MTLFPSVFFPIVTKFFRIVIVILEEVRVRDVDIHAVVEILRGEYTRWVEPIVTEVSRQKDPFKVLVSTIISLRTKDETTRESARRLFLLAGTPHAMRTLTEEEIGRAIYPAGFYRTKSKQIRRIAQILIQERGGRVPDSIEELLLLPGVGRKTANLVVTLGYGKPGICVDTHVHRISNRLGYVRTKTPEKTEFALREKLPFPYWIEYNDLLVSYGKHVCTPISPFCSRCKIERYCDKVGVKKQR
jgi:endonuclease-3